MGLKTNSASMLKNFIYLHTTKILKFRGYAIAEIKVS